MVRRAVHQVDSFHPETPVQTVLPVLGCPRAVVAHRPSARCWLAAVVMAGLARGVAPAATSAGLSTGSPASAVSRPEMGHPAPLVVQVVAEAAAPGLVALLQCFAVSYGSTDAGSWTIASAAAKADAPVEEATAFWARMDKARVKIFLRYSKTMRSPWTVTYCGQHARMSR